MVAKSMDHLFMLVEESLKKSKSKVKHQKLFLNKMFGNCLDDKSSIE